MLCETITVITIDRARWGPVFVHVSLFHTFYGCLGQLPGLLRVSGGTKRVARRVLPSGYNPLQHVEKTGF